jgi:hypothetical protein
MSIQFKNSFNAGTLLPIMVIDWNGKNAVQFSDGNVFSYIYGTYIENCIICGGPTLIFKENLCDYTKPPVGKSNPIINNLPLFDPILFDHEGSGGMCYTDHVNICQITCQAIGMIPTSFSNAKTTNQIIQNFQSLGRCIIDNTIIKEFESFLIDSTNDGSLCPSTSIIPTVNSYTINYSTAWSVLINPDTTISTSNVRMQLNTFNDSSIFSLDTNHIPIITLDNIVTLSNYFNYIITSTLPDPCIKYLIIMSHVYAVTSFFYDSIYQQNNQSNNLYLNYSCLEDFVPIFYKQCNFYSIYTYPPYNLPQLQPFVFYPTVVQSNSDYLITFSLSYKQIIQFLSKRHNDPTIQKQKRLQFMNDLANKFLRDSDGINITTGANLPLSTLSFNDESYNNKDIFDFPNHTYFTYTLDQTGKLIATVYRQPIQGPGYKKNIEIKSITDLPYHLVSTEITLKVETWSVMLLSYFKKNCTDFTIDKKLVYGQVGTVPFTDKEKRTLDDLSSFCNVKFLSKNINYFPSNSLLGQYIYTINSKDCVCYVSQLAPLGSTPPVKPAICFDSKCNTGDPNNPSDVRSMLGITDAFCKSQSYCDQVDEWINNDAYNPGTLDNTRFTNFCPYIDKPEKYNKEILVLGIFFTILFTTLTFLICKNKKYGNLSIFIETSFVLLVFSYLTYYFSQFLVGLYVCLQDDKPGNPSCLSKLYYDPTNNKNTEIKILDEFCVEVTKPRCECEQSIDCGKDCYCVSQTCTPKKGERKQTITKEYKIKYVTLFASLLIAILFPIAFVYASEDYDWHIQKKWSIFTVFILSIVPIVYCLIKTLQKVNVVHLEDPHCG